MKQPTSIRWASLGTVLALLMLIVTPFIGLAQSPASTRPNDPSPATGHAQVIAHGVASLPRGDLVWRLRLDRAPIPERAAALPRPPSFVVGESGVVAVAAADGRVLSRIPVGEAAWMSPGTPLAVVSLEHQPANFLDFAVVPSTDPAARDLVGSAFASPRAAAYDIVLLRDVLTRGEESVLASVTGPAFLYVSSGRVALEDASGGEIDLAAGDVAEFTGEVTIVGVGRQPATFLVAMIGAETPDTVQRRQPRGPPRRRRHCRRQRLPRCQPRRRRRRPHQPHHRCQPRLHRRRRRRALRRLLRRRQPQRRHQCQPQRRPQRQYPGRL
jgi:hypothetical protein